ncbi:PH domain-containing protein [Pseudotenacibaculum sp. MALMAid0570]|uniref:PH domain-containing protein n=1 Tax=Pseudotenacibaculum sp. MALMAid0570 TaxID=3143938 RepID=UPI0032DF2903
MNDQYSFSEFSRQSSKGILVIYGDALYKVLKQTWILAAIFLTRLSKFSEDQLIYIYIGVIIVFIFTLIRSYISYRNFQFKIEDGHFILKKGILKKTNISISFDRIQNINFKQNVIQQVINVYGVGIETAGSQKTEIEIKALSHSKAKALKAQISISSISSATTKKEEEKPLLRIHPKELLKVSLTENHLQSLVLFLAILIGFFQQIEQLFESFGHKDFVGNFIDQGAEVVFGSIILIAILLFFLLVIAIISSFVRVFLRHFNLTLFIKKTALEISQGLFTKKSIILKKQKVQSITISTNPLKRWAGISYVTFKQAVSGKVKKKKDKLIRVVGCKIQQVQKLKDYLFYTDALENQQKEHPDVYYKIRMLIQSLFLLLLLNFVTYLIYSNTNVFFANIFLAPLFYFLVHKKFKKRFYTITDELLLVGKGLIETHYTYFELFKVQNVKMKQTIFQERRDLVDLVLQTASGKIRIPCVKKQTANKIYNYLLYKVETNNKPWM